MVYISIPYVPENNRIDKDLVKKEIEILSIDDDEKYKVYEAIFNLKPRGVDFKGRDTVEIGKLESTLRKLGIPYRRLVESDY
jgi:hypothetical protein